MTIVNEQPNNGYPRANEMNLSIDLKLAQMKYRNQQYMCEVPPVTTVGWSETNWIKWIDKNGTWR